MVISVTLSILLIPDIGHPITKGRRSLVTLNFLFIVVSFEYLFWWALDEWHSRRYGANLEELGLPPALGYRTRANVGPSVQALRNSEDRQHPATHNTQYVGHSAPIRVPEQHAIRVFYNTTALATGSSTSMAVADQNTASPRNSWTQATQQHSHADATPTCDRQCCSPPTALPHAPIVTEGRLYGGQAVGHADTEAVASAQPQLAAQSALNTRFEEPATAGLLRFTNRVSKTFGDMHESWAGGRIPSRYSYHS